MGFSSIKGQEQPVHILQAAISHGHLAHGYLFSGPEGVGKKQTALALAEYLNCAHQRENPPESCGDCPACHKTQLLEHPDLIMIAPDGSSIKIEQIRVLNNKAALRCYEGRYKIIILDDAHLMTNEAANCLLKTLEEPAPNTVFILISAQPQLLPATILSRCQELQFHGLPLGTLQQLLTQQATGHDQESLAQAAALARGSVSQGLALLSDEAGNQARQSLYRLLAGLSQSNPGEILLWCEQWDKNRPMVKTLLTQIQLWYRDQLLCAAGQPALATNPAVQRAPYLPADKLSAIIALAQTALERLERNTTPRLVLEVCLLNIYKLNQNYPLS